MSHLAFLKAFARSTGSVGAITPSSGDLARLMVDWIDWNQVHAALEFGPGTGVFTETVSGCLQNDAFFAAIERDPELVRITRQRCPDVKVIQGCVTEADKYCQEAGVDKVDAIICGLPWAAFSTELQDQCLQAMFNVLPEGGKFATFAYWQGLLLPAGQRFRKLLKQKFSHVEISPTAWRNLPPAFVYRCVR